MATKVTASRIDFIVEKPFPEPPPISAFVTASRVDYVVEKPFPEPPPIRAFVTASRIDFIVEKPFVPLTSPGQVAAAHGIASTQRDYPDPGLATSDVFATSVAQGAAYRTTYETPYPDYRIAGGSLIATTPAALLTQQPAARVNQAGAVVTATPETPWPTPDKPQSDLYVNSAAEAYAAGDTPAPDGSDLSVSYVQQDTAVSDTPTPEQSDVAVSYVQQDTVTASTPDPEKSQVFADAIQQDTVAASTPDPEGSELTVDSAQQVTVTPGEFPLPVDVEVDALVESVSEGSALSSDYPHPDDVHPDQRIHRADVQVTSPAAWIGTNGNELRAGRMAAFATRDPYPGRYPPPEDVLSTITVNAMSEASALSATPEPERSDLTVEQAYTQPVGAADYPDPTVPQSFVEVSDLLAEAVYADPEFGKDGLETPERLPIVSVQLTYR